MRAALVATGAVFVAVAMSLRAQTPALSFDVASIKKNTSGSTTSYNTPPGLIREGQISMVNAPLRAIISSAYDIDAFNQRFRLVGGPESLLSTRFDIRAKPTSPVSRREAQAMFRSLLAERFGLRVHSENRQLPVYALTVLHARTLGPDIRKTVYDCAAWQSARQTNPNAEQPRSVNGDRVCLGYDFSSNQGVMKMMFAGPISDLATRVQAWVDRPVVDATGLTGSFDWVFSFTRDNSPDSDAPSIFQAVQDRLGLKLESRTAPYEIFVIDSVQMPTPD